MNIYELINKLLDSLNELISKGDINPITTNLSNELLETLKIIENCTSCKKNNIKEKDFDKFHKLINEIESEKEELKRKGIINYLNTELINIDNELNRFVLCEGCNEKKIEILIIKCENGEMARLLYEYKLNSDKNHIFSIRWRPFNQFKNINYLAKGGFGEVKKAEWAGCYHNGFIFKQGEVVLKRLYNSSDKILDILKEVNKKKFNINVD